MSFKPVKDRGSKRTSMTINRFSGSHYGVGKTDQRKGYAYLSDFNIPDDKMELRHGAIKNDMTGKSNSIDSMFNMLIGDNNLIGLIHGGVLDLVSVNTDFIQGGVTWAQAEANKDWNDPGEVWV